MKYYDIQMVVSAKYRTSTGANNVEEAKKNALENLDFATIYDLDDIVGQITVIQDVNTGEIIYEK